MTAPRTLAEQLAAAADRPGPDLAAPAFLIARVEYPKLDPGPYLDRIDTFGEAAFHRLARDPGHDAPLAARVDALNRYLFNELGFFGNREQYEDPRNSCLNEVIDRRTGIPISLALVYVEVARRAGLRAEGINFPGHFLVRVLHDLHTDDPDEGLIVDAFHGGAILNEHDCRALLHRHMGDEAAFEPQLLARATRRQILVRMLLNLKRIYVRWRSFPQARTITDLLLAIAPSSMSELRDRGLLAYHMNDFAAALRDLEEYLKLSRLNEPDEDQRKEAEQVWEHVKALRRRVASMN
ncbi:MAG TPA: transglutaminase-like domain-containing protein [Vicinamibacterales bacterium]|nr:transglutaminase-like domain-containing protein [Vicinamibacterales bacterium]